MTYDGLEPNLEKLRSTNLSDRQEGWLEIADVWSKESHKHFYFGNSRKRLMGTGNDQLAEGLISELNVRILRWLIDNEWDERSCYAFHQYIRVVRDNILADYWRDEDNRLSENKDELFWEKDQKTPLIPDNQPIEEQLEEAEWLEAYRRTILSIPNISHAQVAILQRLGGFSLASLSMVLDRAESTVYKHASLAMEYIRGNIQNNLSAPYLPPALHIPSIRSNGFLPGATLTGILPQFAPDTERELFVMLQVNSRRQLKEQYDSGIVLLDNGFGVQTAIYFLPRRQSKYAILAGNVLDYGHGILTLERIRENGKSKHLVHLESVSQFQAQVVRFIRAANDKFFAVANYYLDQPLGLYKPLDRSTIESIKPTITDFLFSPLPAG